MSAGPDPIWSDAEQLAGKLQVIEIVTSLFPRCDLANELEPAEITALLDHLNSLVSAARRDALTTMSRDLGRVKAC